MPIKIRKSIAQRMAERRLPLRFVNPRAGHATHAHAAPAIAPTSVPVAAPATVASKEKTP